MPMAIALARCARSRRPAEATARRCRRRPKLLHAHPKPPSAKQPPLTEATRTPITERSHRPTAEATPPAEATLPRRIATRRPPQDRIHVADNTVLRWSSRRYATRKCGFGGWRGFSGRPVASFGVQVASASDGFCLPPPHTHTHTQRSVRRPPPPHPAIVWIIVPLIPHAERPDGLRLLM
jgi:hypothetical protein